jgi:hypothetical protein
MQCCMDEYQHQARLAAGGAGGLLFKVLAASLAEKTLTACLAELRIREAGNKSFPFAVRHS